MALITMEGFESVYFQREFGPYKGGVATVSVRLEI